MTCCWENGGTRWQRRTPHRNIDLNSHPHTEKHLQMLREPKERSQHLHIAQKSEKMRWRVHKGQFCTFWVTSLPKMAQHERNNLYLRKPDEVYSVLCRGSQHQDHHSKTQHWASLQNSRLLDVTCRLSPQTHLPGSRSVWCIQSLVYTNHETSAAPGCRPIGYQDDPSAPCTCLGLSAFLTPRLATVAPGFKLTSKPTIVSPIRFSPNKILSRQYN